MDIFTYLLRRNRLSIPSLYKGAYETKKARKLLVLPKRPCLYINYMSDNYKCQQKIKHKLFLITNRITLIPKTLQK